MVQGEPAAVAATVGQTPMKARQPICLAAIAGAHGVRGAVRLRTYTEDPADVIAYGPLSDESGDRTFRLSVIGSSRGQIIARIEGVDDRDTAESLKGLRLYVDRARLPEPAEEHYYHTDLVGLAAVRADGTRLGQVSAVHDFGAGDILELALEVGGTMLLPFTRAAVPEVDIAGGRIVVDPPPGLIEERPAAKPDRGARRAARSGD